MAAFARNRTSRYRFTPRKLCLLYVLVVHVICIIGISFFVQNDFDLAQQIKEVKPTTQHRAAPNMDVLMTWGHGGFGVNLDSVKLRKQHRKNAAADFRHQLGLNEYLSNRISLRRSLPDVRDPRCRSKDAPGMTPSIFQDVSVILLFHLEPRSVLLRAVFSILDRTPGEFLTEVILVDQGSESPELSKPQLENYLSAISKKIKVIRSQTSLTYSEAIIAGTSNAFGTAVVFLNARCECTEGWLTPLLAWLQISPTSVAVPVVDTINNDTFKYVRTSNSKLSVATFSWDLSLKRKRIPQYRHPRVAYRPESSPIMADGIFAINRELFIAVGAYTPSLNGTSISNLEFSLRAWLCGSRIELIPCSRVGLISVPDDTLGKIIFEDNCFPYLNET
ncbi:polypeptide n-acetylgalactosaminyltransferase [Plakobranchus ocellatus]|uniref:Polypeptide n-acetylgalactosaminyltransferase n=1 Tax=Plakobranchus ocellatus TaxID=259542 RepID=A0AAV3ZT42_9GAST|nr:polypeptide n-acetylgalactosaminyltransferase [Plakobranchus ocellatus]